jgi:RNA polymerase sigma-70 factor, ECF subfamily
MERPNKTRSGTEELVSPELVDRCKQGDETAWTKLVEATQREVYTLCLRILRNPDDAAEATQDTYLKVWRGLKGFRGDAAFTTWLYRVAMNAAISRQRSRSRKREHETTSEDEMLAQVPGVESVEAVAGARIDVKILESGLDRLPEHYRSAVVLRDVYGCSIEEIADLLKITQSAAKVRVHRGRKQLREMLWSQIADEEETT